MKRRTMLGLLAGLLASASPSWAEPLSPVTIYDAAKIITMEPSIPHARFVAVADGIVLGVADSQEGLRAWTKDRTVTQDHRFAKNVLMPGLIAPFDAESTMIRASFERPDNPSRVMLMPMVSGVPADADIDGWYDGIKARFTSPHVRVDRRIKVLADGAFFSLNMQMNPPGYTDGHEGKWLTEPAVFKAQFKRYWDKGFSLHIHVNGDKGLDEVLAALEPLAPRAAQTVTLEHLGYSTEAQNRRIARMGLQVSAQPNYIRMMGDVYEDAGLGADRSTTMNRLGSLERKGVPMGLHSDFNMAPINPLYLAWIAANRVTIGGHLKAPAERLSLDKALRAITIEAAQVIGMDAMVGSIAAGKKADFAVLDRDPYAGGAAKLRDVKVLGVVFEGRYQPK